MLLRVFEQVLAHRLQPFNNLRVDRRQTQRSFFWLESFKPLTQHGLGRLGCRLFLYFGFAFAFLWVGVLWLFGQLL